MYHTDPAVRAQTSIAPGVTQILPAFAAAGVYVTGLDRINPAMIADAGRTEALASLGQLDLDALAEQPQVVAWRQAYRAMGLKPADHRSSIEQLLRRSLRSGLVSTPSWLTDLYNRVSIAWLAPMGGYDADALGDGGIVIRPVRPDDRFDPIGGGGDRFPLTPRIVAYASKSEILCWAVNHRDAERTALRPETRSAFFFAEAVDKDGAVRAVRALNALANLLAEAGAVAGHVTWVDATEAAA